MCAGEAYKDEMPSKGKSLHGNMMLQLEQKFLSDNKWLSLIKINKFRNSFPASLCPFFPFQTLTSRLVYVNELEELNLVIKICFDGFSVTGLAQAFSMLFNASLRLH